MKKIKIVRVVSIPSAFIHIEETLKFLSQLDVEITLVSSPGKFMTSLLERLNSKNINFYPINMDREVSLASDLVALLKLTWFLIKYRPDIIHSSTPKAGLVTSIAAFLSRVPLRFHTFTGQRWATLNGLPRLFLITLDKLILKLSTEVLADSPSQVSYLHDNGIHPVTCLLKGSFGGVDLTRFSPEKRDQYREQMRQNLGISRDSRVALFLGRVNKDKGVDELISVFETVAEDHREFFLLFVGPYEKDSDPLDSNTEKIMMNHPQIKFLGLKSDPVPYLAACDFLVLPSRREGFGTVVIEAAGMEIPSIGRKISGLVDSIADEQSGLLYETTHTFLRQLKRLVFNNGECHKLGENARLRALKYFDSKILARAQWNYYRSKLTNIRNSQIE